eukprot:gene4564-14743_t
MSDEEQFLLRIADEALAEQLRNMLREEGSLPSGMQLVFEEDNRHGTLTISGNPYKVDLLDLPTVVESFKTYDDINLVKTGDMGQMLLIGGGVKPGQTESIDGVTPPMKNAKHRHFRQLPNVAPEIVARVERDLMAILDGAAPDGVKLVDVEEEFVVVPATGAIQSQVVPGCNKPTKVKWSQAVTGQPAGPPSAVTGHPKSSGARLSQDSKQGHPVLLQAIHSQVAPGCNRPDKNKWRQALTGQTKSSGFGGSASKAGRGATTETIGKTSRWAVAWSFDLDPNLATQPLPRAVNQ